MMKIKMIAMRFMRIMFRVKNKAKLRHLILVKIIKYDDFNDIFIS